MELTFTQSLKEKKPIAAEDEVRKVSDQFYAALNGGHNSEGVGPMSDIWSHSADVTTMHPSGGREVGWDQVSAAWAQAAQIASGMQGHAELADQLISVTGDMAYETGVETGKFTLAGQEFPINHRVTNVYRREGGTWKIVHHHTDATPAMGDLVKSLQAGQ